MSHVLSIHVILCCGFKFQYVSGLVFILISFFVITSDLAGKKCVPCNAKDSQAMSEQSANELLAQVQNDLLTYLFFSFTRHVSDACLIEQVQGWGLLTEGGVLKLHRSWKVKSFTKGLEFFQLVAEIAEAEGCVKTSEDLFLLY